MTGSEGFSKPPTHQSKLDQPAKLSAPSQLSKSTTLPGEPPLSDTPPPQNRVTKQLVTTQSSSQRLSSPPNPQPSSRNPNADMSKLSDGLKALINAPFARPSYTKPNVNILRQTLTKLSQDASTRGVGTPAWLTFTTATAMTMNAPSALTELFKVASSSSNTNASPLSAVQTAELQREVGLKCISFNGIPRSINCLGQYYNSLPKEIQDSLSTEPTREFSTKNIDARKAEGLALWDSVYFGFERKLLNILAKSHPDLPVHIIHSHYANLLSNPSTATTSSARTNDNAVPVGRVLTSLVAIACLRAQTGVGPQVISHVFGLRKAYERPEEGGAQADGEVKVDGGEWLAGEEGNKWLLEWIDEVVKAISSGEEHVGTTFAPGLKAKL